VFSEFSHQNWPTSTAALIHEVAVKDHLRR
jgi:hypothetical protein